MMQRRHFIKSTATFAGLGLTGLPLTLTAEPSGAAQFDAALDHKPWLYGYRSVAQPQTSGTGTGLRIFPERLPAPPTVTCLNTFSP